MKTLGLIFTGFVLGSWLGMSWMSLALFLVATCIVLKRRELAASIMAMTPPEIWVAEPSDNPELCPREDSYPIEVPQPTTPSTPLLRAALPIVELVGTDDGRGRPRRAVVVAVDRKRNQVKVVPNIRRDASDEGGVMLDMSYVRPAGSVPIR